MRKSLFYVIVFLAISLILTGCANNLSSCLKKGKLESKKIEGTFDNVFKATQRALQNQGFIIKSLDHDSGIIKAESGFKRGWLGITTRFEITTTLEGFGENKVLVNFLLVKKVKSGFYYLRPKSSQIVNDPALFRKIYKRIQKEMSLRENVTH